MIKIGDFARMCEVSVPTIRYYDEVGLLKPLSVDSTSGYRYYSVSQMPRLNRIMALKDLGFTLQQIENVLNGGLTLHELQGMLKMKQAEVERLIATERARLCRIAARLRQIEQEDRMSDFDVALKNVSPTLVASCTVTIPTNDQVPEYLGRAFSAVYGHIDMHGAKPVGPCCAIWHQGSSVLENEVAEAMVPIDRATPETAEVKVYEVPAMQVATVVHHGPLSALPLMHKALLSWMETNQYEPAGSYREVYHHTEDNPVTEVQYPVAKS